MNLQNTPVLDQFPNIAGLTWRAARRDDAPAIHRLYLAVDAHDRTNWAGTIQRVENDFDDPVCRVETDTLLAQDSHGNVAALGWVFVNPIAREERRAFLWGPVHPDYRQKGIGTFLLGWLEDRGNRWLKEFDDDLPRVLRLICPEPLQERRVFFEKHGYQAVRSYYDMIRNLQEPIPVKPLPEEIEIASWSPEIDHELMECMNDIFLDHWGTEPFSVERWEMYYKKSQTFRPRESLVVMNNHKVVGGILCCIEQDDGQSVGNIHLLGVCRDWRRRGLASSLLCRSMSLFKENGFEVTSLGVDSENLTGALKIYEDLGFRQKSTILSYFKWI